MDASGPSSLAATSTRVSSEGFFTTMFNRSSSGASPLASSQSNSQANDQLAAATSTANTNTNLSGSFDRSDFPSLGSLSFGNGSFLTASGQQRPQQHQQRLISGAGSGAEDFPSLLASSSLSATGAAITASSTSLARQSSSSSATSQPATTAKVHALGAIVPQSQPPFPQRSIPGSTNGSVTATEKTNGIPLPSSAPASSTSDFGLISLLKLIRMSDNQRNSLALGKDPTLLGWNGDPALFLGSRYSAISATTMPTKNIPAAPALVTAPSSNSAPPIAATNSSSSSTKPIDAPNYQLPICYHVSPPALKTGHFAKFQLETVFYIFYALPRDVLQAYAAQELYHREWRYHSDHKLWFKRVAPSDGISSLNASSTVNYIYFDLQTWERRLFTGIMNAAMKQGFLSEQEVAVHFTSS